VLLVGARLFGQASASTVVFKTSDPLARNEVMLPVYGNQCVSKRFKGTTTFISGCFRFFEMQIISSFVPSQVSMNPSEA
jgi:hypothetical protein